MTESLPARSHDPVCNENVHPTPTHRTASYGGERYFFCSQRCLQTFEADPRAVIAEERLCQDRLDFAPGVEEDRFVEIAVSSRLRDLERAVKLLATIEIEARVVPTGHSPIYTLRGSPPATYSLVVPKSASRQAKAFVEREGLLPEDGRPV